MSSRKPAKKTVRAKPGTKGTGKSAGKTTSSSTATGKPVAKKATRAVGKTAGKPAARKKAPEKKSAPVPAKRTDGGKAAAPKTAPAPRKSAKAAAHDELKFLIDSAFERRSMLTPDEVEGSTRPAVERAIEGLESGEFRVAEPDGKGGWTVN